MQITPKITINDFLLPDYVSEVSRPIPPVSASFPGPVPHDHVPKPTNPALNTKHFLLSDLSSEELGALCNKFRDDVFKKAGRVQPARAVTESPAYLRDRIQLLDERATVLEESLKFMVDHIGQPYSLETRDGFDRACSLVEGAEMGQAIAPRKSSLVKGLTQDEVDSLIKMESVPMVFCKDEDNTRL